MMSVTRHRRAGDAIHFAGYADGSGIRGGTAGYSRWQFEPKRGLLSVLGVQRCGKPCSVTSGKYRRDERIPGLWDANASGLPSTTRGAINLARGEAGVGARQLNVD
jgi:hypothetical protein